MAPEGEWIFRSGRYNPDMEKRREAIQSIRDRQDLRRQCGRNWAIHGMRLILLPDADNHLRVLPVEPRIVASHYALQGRKLSDYTGQQIGFA